jgi:hypothetical protein
LIFDSKKKYSLILKNCIKSKRAKKKIGCPKSPMSITMAKTRAVPVRVKKVFQFTENNVD